MIDARSLGDSGSSTSWLASNFGKPGNDITEVRQAAGSCVQDAKVNVPGLTFKENCGDLRNGKVIDIVRELRSCGVEVFVADPQATAEEARHENGVSLHALIDAKAAFDQAALQAAGYRVWRL